MTPGLELSKVRGLLIQTLMLTSRLHRKTQPLLWHSHVRPMATCSLLPPFHIIFQSPGNLFFFFSCTWMYICGRFAIIHGCWTLLAVKICCWSWAWVDLEVWECFMGREVNTFFLFLSEKDNICRLSRLCVEKIDRRMNGTLKKWRAHTHARFEIFVNTERTFQGKILY